MRPLPESYMSMGGCHLYLAKVYTRVGECDLWVDTYTMYMLVNGCDLYLAKVYMSMGGYVLYLAKVYI